MELSPQRRRYLSCLKVGESFWERKLRLRERDKEIIELRNQGLTLQSIGQKYGITRERVRVICKRNRGGII